MIGTPACRHAQRYLHFVLHHTGPTGLLLFGNLGHETRNGEGLKLEKPFTLLTSVSAHDGATWVLHGPPKIRLARLSYISKSIIEDNMYIAPMIRLLKSKPTTGPAAQGAIRSMVWASDVLWEARAPGSTQKGKV